MMGKRVLVTGGFGYLGGQIAMTLSRDAGYTVRLGGRMQKQPPSWLPEAEMALMNVLEPLSLQSALQDVHMVVHLAAKNEHDCLRDPNDALLVNGLGTLNVLQAAINAGVERFIYFSTAHVYGAPLVGHITEQSVPRPLHPYAITHHIGEDFVLAAHEQNKIMGAVLRLSNGFGAAIHPDVNRWTLLVNDLCRQIIQTGEMILHSSGTQQRDFIPLKDIGGAVVHLLALSHEQSSDGLFNLGGDSSLSVWEMTQRIALRCQIQLGFTPKIHRPASPVNQASEQMNLIYDSSKIKQTGFQLKESIDDAIDEALACCKLFFKREDHYA